MARPHPRPGQAPRRVLTLMRLEDRANPSVTLSGGLLHIQGTNGPDTAVVGYRTTGGVTAYEIKVSENGGPQMVYTAPLNSVQLIRYEGYSGNNYFFNGTSVSSLVWGGDGNDTLIGGTGNDFIDGGSGDDVIYGGLGNDNLQGNSGNDTIFGNAGNDYMIGGAGNDIMYGGDGNDYMTGGDGNDLLVGGAGDDFLDGGWGNDALYGEAGRDVLWGGPGADYLNGGDGDDYLDGGYDGARDTLVGGAGSDTFKMEYTWYAGHPVRVDIIADYFGGGGGYAADKIV